MSVTKHLPSMLDWNPLAVASACSCLALQLSCAPLSPELHISPRIPTPATASQVDRDWMGARNADTMDSYEAFRGIHPGSQYDSLAVQLVSAHASLRAAVAQDTLPAYVSFLARHLHDPFGDRVVALIYEHLVRRVPAHKEPSGLYPAESLLFFPFFRDLESYWRSAAGLVPQSRESFALRVWALSGMGDRAGPVLQSKEYFAWALRFALEAGLPFPVAIVEKPVGSFDCESSSYVAHFCELTGKGDRISGRETIKSCGNGKAYSGSHYVNITVPGYEIAKAYEQIGWGSPTHDWGKSWEDHSAASLKVTYYCQSSEIHISLGSPQGIPRAR